MSRRTARRASPGIALVLLLLTSLGVGAEPAEPSGYRLENYRAPTPATVTGGTAIDTSVARQLWKTGGAAWIDVLAAPRRPASLPASAVWLPVPHRDIPGSLWLPDIGHGKLDAKLEAYFRTNLEQITRGQRDAPLVFYCLSRCWLSWNAAKRAASWGYTRIYWYRDGTDGWEGAKLPLETTTPVPGFQ